MGLNRANLPEKYKNDFQGKFSSFHEASIEQKRVSFGGFSHQLEDVKQIIELSMDNADDDEQLEVKHPNLPQSFLFLSRIGATQSMISKTVFTGSNF